MRLIAITLITIALLLAFNMSIAGAQKMMPSGVCDFYVNGVRVTWPPHYTSTKDCMALIREFAPRKKDGTEIKCQCVEGSSRG